MRKLNLFFVAMSYYNPINDPSKDRYKLSQQNYDSYDNSGDSENKPGKKSKKFIERLNDFGWTIIGMVIIIGIGALCSMLVRGCFSLTGSYDANKTIVGTWEHIEEIDVEGAVFKYVEQIEFSKEKDKGGKKILHSNTKLYWINDGEEIYLGKYSIDGKYDVDYQAGGRVTESQTLLEGSFEPSSLRFKWDDTATDQDFRDGFEEELKNSYRSDGCVIEGLIKGLNDDYFFLVAQGADSEYLEFNRVK